MKAKKTARILCALSAAALCLSCISAPAFAVTYNGGEHGTFMFGGYEYTFSAILQNEVSYGGYRSTCSTQAAVARTHYNLSCKWLTKNYGYVTATGGYREYSPKIEGSMSDIVSCPKGREQVVEYTRVDARILFKADRNVTSSIYRTAK